MRKITGCPVGPKYENHCLRTVTTRIVRVALMNDAINRQPHPADVSIRRATIDDYDAFAQLFPELLVPDPVPPRTAWETALAPATFVAASNERIVGYCYFEELFDTGYVRNLVVSPTARRRGVGRALLQSVAEHLRGCGKTSWRLNVRSSNQAAIALYEKVGLHTKYFAVALRLPWSAVDALPAGAATIDTLDSARDAQLEGEFAIPTGQLALARNKGRLLFEARAFTSGQPVGLAVFDPKFPGAFPFRVSELGAVTPLLRVMRRHVPTDTFVNLVVEDDERLSDLLSKFGASVREEMFHLEGAL